MSEEDPKRIEREDREAARSDPGSSKGSFRKHVPERILRNGKHRFESFAICAFKPFF